MRRLPTTAIFAYAVLSAAQWGHAARWLYAPPGKLWCGNVVSDPFMLLVNLVCPLAAVCAVVLVLQCVKSRRWPCFEIMALLTFVLTAACLVSEWRTLRSEFGVPLGRIWWLPWL